MDESFQIVKLFGIPFNVSNIISGTLVALVFLALVFWFSRDLKLKPTGRQNMLEWLIDFTNGIIKGVLPDEEGKKYRLFAFVLFAFIFIANQAGLIFQFDIAKHGQDFNFFRSPTASATTTLTLALMVLVLSHAAGVQKFGFKGYVKNTYLKPFFFLFPINLLEQFTNFMTLALRLFGNIYAGEVLLEVIGGLVKAGPVGFVSSSPLEMIWQAFSVFIGAIQAYVFVTLTMVYISQKVEEE